MVKKIKTISDATREWTREFSAFPHSMIEELMKNDIDSWHEVTLPAVGDRVYVNYARHRDADELIDMLQGELETLENDEPEVCDLGWNQWEEKCDDLQEKIDVLSSDYEGDGEIVEINDEDIKINYIVRLDSGEDVVAERDDIELDEYSYLPMWGTLWQFGNACDDWWAEKKDGLQAMSDCGFRIYEHDEWGYFFGIDGAGYSFHDNHFIPLYKARGLQWHDKDESEVA